MFIMSFVSLGRSKAKSRKNRGVTKVKSREKTRQVRESLSQQFEQKHPPPRPPKNGMGQVSGRVSTPWKDVDI